MIDIHIICNPTAGKGSAADALNKIKDWIKFQENLNIIIHLTEKEGHATEITKDLTSQNRPVTLIIIGGDGTIGEVLNGIVNFDLTTIGIIPFGSGNDFVKSLQLTKKDPVALISEYVNIGKMIKADYMLVNDKYRAINSCGLGMSAEVVATRNAMKHFKPATQYKLASMKCALAWKGFEYEMSVDGKEPEHVKCMWFAMTNGTHVGGGLRTAPDGLPNDGKMTVMYLKTHNRLKTLPILTKTKKGKALDLKQSVHFQAKQIDLVLNDNNVEYDGNVLQHQYKLNVKVIPGKLNLLVC